MQGGWETPGAVTGRRAGRQRAHSVALGLLREEKTKTHTHTHTPLHATVQPHAAWPHGCRWRPLSEQEVHGDRQACQHPGTGPGGCLGCLGIPADPMGSYGDGWYPRGETGMSQRWRPPAAQPPASHPCLCVCRGGVPVGLRAPTARVPPGLVSPSRAPASCSNAFCHRVPLWQSCKAGRVLQPCCISHTWCYPR